MSRHCEMVTLPDGTVVRVQFDRKPSAADLAVLEELAAAVRRRETAEPVPVPGAAS